MSGYIVERGRRWTAFSPPIIMINLADMTANRSLCSQGCSDLQIVDKSFRTTKRARPRLLMPITVASRQCLERAQCKRHDERPNEFSILPPSTSLGFLFASPFLTESLSIRYHELQAIYS